MAEYRFYLYHKDVGRYTRIKDPVGWDALGKKIRRFGLDPGAVGIRWHGIFFEYNVKLQFIKDGKAFIQTYYEKYGIEQEILLRIDKRDQTRKFEKDYEGRLNLTTYKISTIYVECNVENTGFLQKMKNRVDIKVDLGSLVSQGGTGLDSFANETQNIPLHSKVVTELYTGKIGEADISNNFVITAGKYFQFDFANDISEIDTKYNYPNATDLTSRPFEMFEFTRPGSYTFDMRVSARISTLSPTGDNTKIKFYVQKNDETPVEFSIESSCLFTIPAGGGLLYFDVRTVNHTFTIAKGDKVYWYGKNTDSITWQVTIFPDASSTFFDNNDGYTFTCAVADKNTNAKVTGLTTTPASNCKMVMIYEAWTRLIQGITDRKDKGVFYSDYYGRTDLGYSADGAGSLRGITNGNQVRGIDKPIYVSQKEMVDLCLAIDGMGFGIETINGVQRVRVEPLTYWYQTKRMMRLEYVLDIEKNVESNLYFNTVQSGIDNWKNNRASTLDEFVGRKEFSLPITQIKSALSLKSPYITSGYTLEYARRETDISKDNVPAGTDVDNSNFVVQLRRSGGSFVPDKNEDFTSVSGIVSPATSYNLKLSPKRCLLRNGRLLRTALERYKDLDIKFSNGDANNGMASQLTTETAPLVENAAIRISTLDKPLFYAEVYKIRAKLTRAQLMALNNVDALASENAWGFVEFSGSDHDFKRGYLLDAQVSPDSNETVLHLLKAAI